MSAGILGAIRTAASIAVWAALLAVLSYFSDATHLSGLVNGGLATLIAATIGSLEQHLAAQSNTALFGAVRTS